MKPFDLEAALRGEPVVTRDGREVTQLHDFAVNHPQTLRGVLDGQVFAWLKDGCYMGQDIDHRCDLFMAQRKRSVWVNVYPDEYAYFYKTEKKADEMAVKGRIGGKAWPLEIEE